MPLTLYCATANPGKLAEFQRGVPPDLRLVPSPPFDCAETGQSFQENAIHKALCCSNQVGALVFADDSGLEVDQLGGAPGIHSARYAGPQATDEQNRALLIERLRLAASPIRPRARFVCVLALALPQRLLATFDGVTEGEIVDSPRGAGGFGYDPLFYFPPLGRTFAQLTAEEKFNHSHRGKAFRAMLAWLRANSPL